MSQERCSGALASWRNGSLVLMECRNHSGVPAAERCTGCAEGFCNECLVEVAGQKYCASCKVMAVKGPPPVQEGDKPCETAGKALTYSILAFFCFGIIFGPIAVSKAVEAKKEIRQNPELAGLAKANVAMLLGIAAVFFWIINAYDRFSK